MWPDKNRQMLPKNYFTRKIKYFDTLQNLPTNVGDLGQSIVAKGFKNLSKVQKITKYGHTGHGWVINEMVRAKNAWTAVPANYEE